MLLELKAMPNITHVLCPVDFSEFTDRALMHAATMAKWYGARLTALHVFASVGMADVIPTAGVAAPAPVTINDLTERGLFEGLRKHVDSLNLDTPADVVIREAPDVAHEVIERASELGVDFIVMGSHGRSGLERLILGSVAEHVLRHAKCPVMVVPRSCASAADQAIRIKRIVCPVDFADSALTAVEYALSVAEESDAHLTLLHVVGVPRIAAEVPLGSPDPEDARLAAAALWLPRLHALVPDEVRTYCTVDEAIELGQPAHAILHYAAQQHADLIVMGVMGRGPVDLMLFGSTTQKVIRGSTCPVLTVRAH
jgi:nucleotide-binding universal stress UspA family protein